MKIIGRIEKENLLGQKSKAIWLTGLSGAGKTTLAIELEKKLFSDGFITKVLDGDVMRNGLNSNLGFSSDDRYENIRRIAEVAKILIDTGIVCICSFISPTNKTRSIAREILENNYIEIFVNAPLEICEKRDIKGLYKKARSGEIKEFTGISAPYEIPENPDFIVQSYNKPVEESVREVYNFILPYVSIKMEEKELLNIG